MNQTNTSGSGENKRSIDTKDFVVYKEIKQKAHIKEPRNLVVDGPILNQSTVKKPNQALSNAGQTNSSDFKTPKTVEHGLLSDVKGGTD